ncbi:palmitoyl-protein thioesterase precursor [Aspergillus eucalypticola CBS 122712]|uniref:Palmitoyl-protein thioesterase 1 n=1 Tax=Aspergillus eucalypticola (strain CBS 122712 / IBT 29274) TaxID=1448314 RepID=A0A317VP28_ASPEC|nr:palmitoyl-protein thioesterase precursor [Aspergillus eucalypticola CBS 122712]PWY74827.1 palmitoyl-protein thioesterase precursor [Aspergillus eucalypticola CBS 122712]
MRPLTPFLTLLPLLPFISAHPTHQVQTTTTSTTNTTTELRALPLVIWHGLGDQYQSPSLQHLIKVAEDANPGTYTYLIHLSPSSAGDRQATFLGNLTEQIASVCSQLLQDPILSTAPAINALGFSQGGQFLRGYIERCNAPPVRTLITLGSQHNGISQFQSCAWNDFICRGAEALLRSGRWSTFVQGRLVPAQYFRDPEPSEMEEYLKHSNFLADVNNERVVKNETYKENLGKLEKFVMYMFENDRMVVPKESSWFGEVDGESGGVVGVRERSIYKEDWIGLRELDERGGLVFRTLKGGHMEFDEEELVDIFREFLGPIEVEIPDDEVEVEIDERARLVSQGGYYY